MFLITNKNLSLWPTTSFGQRQIYLNFLLDLPLLSGCRRRRPHVHRVVPSAD